MRAPTAAPPIRVHAFASAVFGNSRQLRVLLPPGYDAPESRERRYPVLYLNDGQNLFDSSTSSINPMEWRVDETAHELITSSRIPPIIIVGIDNTGRRGRFREYFPYVDEYLRPPEPNPQGTKYPAFLVDEVLPFINARYRTLRDAASTGIGGSSAGALAAVYSVITRPGTFGRLLVESPSLYVDDYHVLRDAAEAGWPDRVYLGVGTNEGGRSVCRIGEVPEPQLVRDVRRLAEMIQRAGHDSSRLRVVVEQCARHNEQAWAARLPVALTFLFGKH